MTTPSTPAHKTPSKSAQLLSVSKLSAYTPTHSRQSLAPLTPSAAQAHAQSLHETFTVLSELIHEYRNSTDECALIARLLAAKQSVRAEMAHKNAQMKELIEGLTVRVEGLTTATSQPASVGLQQQQQLLLQKKATLSSQISALTLELERLEATGAAVDGARRALAAQKAESEAAARRKMPAMAGTMGLYRNFSSIAWDYDVDEDVMVKGTFHFDGKSSAAATAAAPAAAPAAPSVKSFQFSRKEMSDFDIANQLWDMMEAQ